MVGAPFDVSHAGEHPYLLRTAAVDGRALELTYLEFELLAHLVAHPGRVHTRDQLVTTVWGYKYTVPVPATY